MNARDLGKSLEQLIEEIVLKTAKAVAKELPSEEQLKLLEERTKSIEVTLSHILKKSGGNPLRRSNRGRKPGEQRICSSAGCNRPVVARGMCSMHYQRWRADQQTPKSGAKAAAKTGAKAAAKSKAVKAKAAEKKTD
ncbi:MAG: hypothetical protein JW819_05845 [Candidatus Krumholzibacteriota bacterium]|nr:hypothetical protein [Candidatus Krumholzibacteriota bacterium]